MGLKLGVHVGQQNMSMAQMRALWKKLDDKVDWISAWDHFYEAPPAGGTIDHFEAMTTLGALAADTKKARLGCLVFYVGYRNPASIAKAAATLDHISGGRFELGLGAGWHEQEARAYGYDFPPVGTRLDMLDEATTIIRGLLDDDRTTFHGKHFRVEDAANLPAPMQDRMPIWIGGVGEKKTLRLVAKHADGWNAAYIPPEAFSRLGGVLDGWCEKLGRDPGSIKRSINLSFNLATDEAAAARELDNLRKAWGPAASRIEGGALIGTPKQAIERLGEYEAAGAGQVNVALRAPWNADALDAFLDEVVPALR
ncbi:MAG: TIGR03560 family F420-dependent LLM class oxidoreductase [Pseudomonadales bacterium]|nr:TIGR03560 family F420-dependent LLM class oxidoreductase [Pseudomonadales bacterium]